MKRIIFTLLLAFASSIVFTACTEEEVAPQTAQDGSSGGIILEPVNR